MPIIDTNKVLRISNELGKIEHNATVPPPIEGFPHTWSLSTATTILTTATFTVLLLIAHNGVNGFPKTRNEDHTELQTTPVNLPQPLPPEARTVRYEVPDDDKSVALSLGAAAA